MFTEVPLGPADPTRFKPLLDGEQWNAFSRVLRRGSRALGGRRMWFVNSTARGGGVAEMLQSLLRYLVGAGIDARWLVVEGTEEFFDVTKRLHNMLHGAAKADGVLGPRELAAYTARVDEHVGGLTQLARPGDAVLLQDPQTANLAPGLSAAGLAVVWTCHVGVDAPNEVTRAAWDVLRPFVRAADALVFSRAAYVWEGLADTEVAIIPPCIDAFSPKNQEHSDEQARDILGVAGIQRPDGEVTGEPTFRRLGGTRGTVARRPSSSRTSPSRPTCPSCCRSRGGTG